MPSLRFAAAVLAVCVSLDARAAIFGVSVNTSFFSPATVIIHPGDTVQWTWAGGAIPHSVTSDSGLWTDTGLKAAPFTFSYTFGSVGSYRYYCSLHGGPGGLGMSGMVVVTYETTTSIATSKTPTVFGESATLTATVTPAQPTGITPTGSVTFFNSGVLLCSGIPLDSSATATCSTAPLLVGSHSMTAQYSGDVSYSNSTSSPIIQIVNKASTSTTVSSSSPSSFSCLNVTFSATTSVVAPGSAANVTGTVTFFDGVTPICSGVTMSAGSAQCSTSTLSPGDHDITAQYSGTTQLNGSTSPVLTQSILAPLVGKPAGFLATAQSGINVKLQWNDIPGAAGFDIDRRTLYSDPENVVLSVSVPCGSTVSVLFDNAPALDTTYIYRVRAVGGNVSDWSDPDIATTFYFTNRPAPNGAIAAVDMADLRHAANKVAAAAGQGPSSFANDPLTPNVSTILALDLIAIRHILTSAFPTIGILGPGYTDSDETALVNQTVPIKAMHFTELQDLIK